MPFEGSFAGSGPRLPGEPASSLPLPGLVPGPPDGCPPPHLCGHFPRAHLQTSSSDPYPPKGERTKVPFPGAHLKPSLADCTVG